MRQAQQQRLADFGTRVRWVERASDIPAQAALWICNELLDAFAVHRLQWSGGRWWEMAVQAADHDGLQWNLLEPDAALLPLLAAHPGPWLEDQCIEINLAALHWIDEVAQSAFEGLICIADYGMDEEELWSLERPKGTLRRYQQHRCDDDLLKELGECDLTSHVNFSQVRRRATEAGLRVRDEQPQGIFLTHLAKPWLGSLEGKPPDAAQAALLRQFHTLTHPSQMGSAFRVLTLEKEALTNPICQQAAATHH
jgi:SAM-dependent MidA family methyltransferase